MENANSNTYFIARDLQTASSVVNSLKDHKIPEDAIGVVGDQNTLAIANLPEADLTETTDATNAAKRGTALGIASGFLAGLAITAFPPAGVALGGSTVAAMTAGGGAFGAWTATMIGVSEDSPLVDKFSNELDDDAILVFADITHDQDKVMKTVAETNAIPLDDFGSI